MSVIFPPRKGDVAFEGCEWHPICKAHELLQPHLKDIRQAFDREFVGMTVDETSLDALLSTRQHLIAKIRSHLDETSELFLRSFHALKPDWDLISSSNIRNLPAIRWKLMNLERLHTENPEKYQALLQSIDATLSGSEPRTEAR